MSKSQEAGRGAPAVVSTRRRRTSLLVVAGCALVGGVSPLAAAISSHVDASWSMVAPLHGDPNAWTSRQFKSVMANSVLDGGALMATPRSPQRFTRGTWETDATGPNARANWFYYQRAYPLGEIPVGALQDALAEAQLIPELQRQSKATGNSLWRQVGPVGFDSSIEPTWGRMSGRVRALAIDPNNPARLLLGTATGGVWLSTDTGTSWRALTDTQPSLAIGAVAIDPSNANVFYAGSGEGNGTYYSAGILKSVDGGANWTVLGANLFNRGAISDMAVSPQDGNVLVVCARSGQTLSGGTVGTNVGGIYRSTDGGQTFTQTANNFCTGLRVVESDFNVMYHSATGVGAQNGVYRSTDAGATWALISGAVNGTEVGRLSIGLSRTGTTIHLGGKMGNNVVLQNSTDSGATWSTPLVTPLPANIQTASHQLYCESQCGYDNAVAVNPFDAGDVYFGGVGMFRTRDGGVNFTQVGSNNTGGGPLHVDHHLVLFHPTAAGVVYNTSDGGIYRSSDGGATWASLGGNLATLQPYHISLHPTNAAIMFTGNQDNGTTRRSTSDVWTEVGGGDGGYSAINYVDTQIVYSTTTNLNIAKSNNGGTNFTAPITQVPKEPSEPVAFIAPILMDPVNPEVIYGATNRLWRSADGAQTWTPSVALPAAPDGYITQMAIAPSDTSIVYTVASDGTVSRGAAGTFASVTSAPLPGRHATSVVVHPTNPSIVYVGFSGFDDGTPAAPGHVFKTLDAGATWTNITANLPDVPVNAVALRPDQPNEVYVGTDVGVFISLDGGGVWARMNNVLPNAGVSALAVNATTNLLAAATYGRSVWVTDLRAAPAAELIFANGFE